jgi:presenilin-like A22 family membrane protease
VQAEIDKLRALLEVVLACYLALLNLKFLNLKTVIFIINWVVCLSLVYDLLNWKEKK